MPKKESNPQDKASMAQDWVEWFNRSAQAYDNPKMKMAYYTDGLTGTPVPDEVMTATYDDILRKLNIQKDHSVLDAGCGSGLFYKHAHVTIKNLVGIDLSTSLLKAAHTLNPDGTFINSAIFPLPFRNDQFDRVVSYSVFHYLPTFEQTKKAVKELVRVCKNNGIVFIGDLVDPTQSQPHFTPAKIKKHWWPKVLNHNLKKLRFDQKFFKDLAKQENLVAEILPQNIPGRFLPDVRFDVRFKVKK